MRVKPFRIGRQLVGRTHRLFVIAELGLNHGGSPERAIALVDAAAAAGASAVKLQTLRAERLVAASCPPPSHVDVPSLREFFRRFELDEDAHAAVVSRARELGLAFMSTPFDEDAVDLLERLGCDAYKIASGDLTHLPLIERAARTGRPLVISTGMSTLDEIGDALECARAAGARHVALLHCVSAYPVPAGQENLLAIRTLADRFDVPVGLSDHGTSPLSAIVAVSLGAVLLEKHLVIERDGTSVDEAVSATPAELRAMTDAAEHARVLLGNGRKLPGEAEAVNRDASRRGLYARRALAAGEIIRDEDIDVLRPATGVPPCARSRLAGTRALRDIPAGTAFVASDLRADMRRAG